MALIDKETICAEIERLRDEYTEIAIDSHYGTVNANHVVDDLEQLLSFLDTLPEQPVTDCHDLEQGLEVDLEKEIDKYLEPIEAWQIQEAPFTSMENIARHFYELGCTRTAVIYDDIEYERQRAEEAELSGDLEEAADKYAHSLGYDAEKEQLEIDLAKEDFIVGAEWDRAKMIERAVAVEVVGDKRDLRLIDSTERCLFNAKCGDWLKVIVIPEE